MPGSFAPALGSLNLMRHLIFNHDPKRHLNLVLTSSLVYTLF
jgi:hypothetical protein